jgi:HEAT repeat protein
MTAVVSGFSRMTMFLLVAATASAQTPAAPETAALSQGWALLAQGEAARASDLAQGLIVQYPGNPAVLSLAIEADLARTGVPAALDTYERWLGTRVIEEPYALRRIARGLLHEVARDRQARGRALAVDVLVADGDPTIVEELQQAASPGDPITAGVLGAAGDPQAVAELIAAVESRFPDKRQAISGLGKSRSPVAVQPLVQLLADRDPTTRMQAAEALGQLGSAQAIPALKPLLNDPVFTVKFAAATALFALNDPSGTPLLREMQASEQPGVRLDALRATKSQPDAAWLQQVRELTADPDPDVRRQAAELLAAHDPDAARATLEPLMSDSNPAQREAASDTYLRYAATDFPTLRRMLRSADGPARVRAAARILELTR